MLITSVNNNRIKDICKLKEKKYRDSTNTFIIEGKNLVNEAYKKNLLKEIYVLEGTNISLDIDTFYVTREVMKKISSTDSIPSIVGICYKREESSICGCGSSDCAGDDFVLHIFDEKSAYRQYT